MNYIKAEDKGWKVKLIQELLGIEITGNFDYKTFVAVKKFQRNNQLEVDGIVGEKTFCKLSGLKYCRRWTNKIILHCSATKENFNVTVEQIDKWHRIKGWKGIGYHYVIYLDGSVHEGRDINIMGAHCEGQNACSIGVCYIGGLADDAKTPKDTRTEEQKKSLVRFVRSLMILHALNINDVHCHNEYANKACPCFEIDSFRQELING